MTGESVPGITDHALRTKIGYMGKALKIAWELKMFDFAADGCKYF
jgi:hypothetical protein